MQALVIAMDRRGFGAVQARVPFACTHVPGVRATQEQRRLASGTCPAFCTDSQIGIHHAHLECWQRACGHAWTLVLEEDAYLVADFLEKFAEVPAEADVLLLGNIIEGMEKPQPWDRLLHLLTTGRVGFPARGYYDPGRMIGTHAYAVSGRGAQKLLRLADKANFHVDATMTRLHRQGKIRMVGVNPSLAYQGEFHRSCHAASLTASADKIDRPPMGWALRMPVFQWTARLGQVILLGVILVIWGTTRAVVRSRGS